MAGIPRKALVFVGDGSKALLLRNEGDDRFPNLKAEAVFEDQNPATHLQGTDRPGHFVKGIVSGQRGAVEPTNWHELEEYLPVFRCLAGWRLLKRRQPNELWSL
jgi:protein required for attachment to host cells